MPEQMIKYRYLTITGILESAIYSAVGFTTVMLYVDLKEGSSRQGNARRAYVGSNFVVAKPLRIITLLNTRIITCQQQCKYHKSVKHQNIPDTVITKLLQFCFPVRKVYLSCL